MSIINPIWPSEVYREPRCPTAVRSPQERGIALQLSRKHLVPLLATVLLVVVAGGGFVIGRKSAPATSATIPPWDVPLPANARLTRTETYFIDNVHNWYYMVARNSEDGLIAFYQAQLPKDGWRCVTSMKTTHMTYYGQSLAGTGVYLTALRGMTKAQVYMGDQEYGAFLLSDDLPDGSIALKLSFEPAGTSKCG
jgi:hypothetical protein